MIRIVIIMSDASMWKPEYVNGVINKLPENYSIIGAVLTNFRPRKTPYFTHLWRYFTMLGPLAFTIMAFREIYHGILNYIDRYITLPSPHSIAGVCRRHEIPIFKAKNVNSDEALRWITDCNPDILLSSGNQIFGKKLLAIPTIASLNRHTSLLPAYGGIYPIFWCLLNGEREVGISIHTMTPKIDEGIVIAQEALSIKPTDTFFSLFETCFRLSEDLTIIAIKKVAHKDFSSIPSKYEKSYYSYPTTEDVRRFRATGRRIL